MIAPDNEKSVRGKGFVLLLLFGFIAFTVVMLYGTMFIGKAAEPGLKRRSEEEVRRIREQRTPAEAR